MNEIYLVSGLAADERVFQFLDFHGRSIHNVRWVTPYKNESIENYATRLIEQIPTPNPIIIGLSFGGMLAVEIAKQIKTEKVILISSAKGRKEIPPYLRWVGSIQLDRIIPAMVFKKSHFVALWFFGPRKDNERELLRQLIKDADPVFTKWAIRKVLTWTNETEIKNLKHIHGTADKVLPSRYVKADKIINNGEHFMIISQAAEVSQAIDEFLSHA